MAADVVGPILYGAYGWGEFELDGVVDGKRWVGVVLVCGNGESRRGDRFTDRDSSCHHAMREYIAGRRASGPVPRTFRGGRGQQPSWPQGVPERVALPTALEGTDGEA